MSLLAVSLIRTAAGDSSWVTACRSIFIPVTVIAPSFRPVPAMNDRYSALRLNDELQRAAAAPSAVERTVHLAACRLLSALAQAGPGVSRPHLGGAHDGAGNLG